MNKYLPSFEKLSQETLATLFAIVASAWIISKVPALRDLVRSTNNP